MANNPDLKSWCETVEKSDAKKLLIEKRNEIKKCPLCAGNIEDRVVTIFDELIVALYSVYQWCGKNARHEFKMADIRGLMGHNEYARFGDLIRWGGGLLYRPHDQDKRRPKGVYGMNMARAKEFFHGKRPMPSQGKLNQITGERTVLKESFIGEFPALSRLMTAEGVYDHEKLL